MNHNEDSIAEYMTSMSMLRPNVDRPTIKVLIAGGYSKSLLFFRVPLIRAMQGHYVKTTACAAEIDQDTSSRLAEFGVRYESVHFRRAGLDPLSDWSYLKGLRLLMLRERFDVVFAYTHKPVIYSALAAGRLKPNPRVYPLITGLGYTFIGKGLKARCAQLVLCFLYRRASRHFTGVFFQNSDDHTLFRNLGLIRPETPVCIVRGSGIDLEQFPFAPLGENLKPENRNLRPEGSKTEDKGLENPRVSDLESLHSTQVSGLGFAPLAAPKAPASSAPQRSAVSDQPSGLRHQVSGLKSQVSITRSARFLLIARLLGDKGIREYAAAARVIKKAHPDVEFHLVGPADPNPAAISPSEVESWRQEGIITYHGSQSDVRPFLRDCTVYVLPSYREGTPRTVLEAMATGRAVITTDAPGCRETVFGVKAVVGSEQRVASSSDALVPGASDIKQGENGLLVPVKSVDALVAAMRRFVENPELAVTMGNAGRRLAEEYYDVHKVNQQMMEFMGLAAKPPVNG